MAYSPKSMGTSEIIFSVQESAEGGFEARALDYSNFTQADWIEQLKTMIRDAVSCHFDSPQEPFVIRERWKRGAS